MAAQTRFSCLRAQGCGDGLPRRVRAEAANNFEGIMMGNSDIKQHTHRTGFTGNDEWYTPARYIEMARTVMGQIDVDPASNDFAQKTVKAATYYTAETNGLGKEWRGKVWMNPPYSRALVGQFIRKLVFEYRLGRCTEAIVLTNNSTDTGWFTDMSSVDATVCFPRGRIRFQRPDGTMGRTPPQGQMFTYLGLNPSVFARVFGALGFVGSAPANDNSRNAPAKAA